MLDLLILAGIAGLAAFAGAGLGWFEQIKPDWLTCESRHFIVAFGGGALLAAVGLVLVPKGMAAMPLYISALSFVAGAVVFMCVDRFFAYTKTKLSQFMALMLDFVPESILLGAIITQNYREAVFLTALIVAQNLPEGFNAYREVTAGKGAMRGRTVLFLMALAGLSGLAWASIGFFLLGPQSVLLKLGMMFCAGGILFLVFRDVAPDARVKHEFLPSLGAVAGFSLGIVGHGLV